jgi:ribose 5-phosphate isomerase A
VGQQRPASDGSDESGAVSPRLQETWKLEAARAATRAVPDGYVLGLGSGTTAELMLQALAERVHAGLRVVGVPTSERTRQRAATLGIPLADLDDVATLDMSIDGADEVMLPTLDLIKGRGGALLREKLIAAASRYRVIIVDASKLVSELGSHSPVPIEVTPFGWRHTAERIAALAGRSPNPPTGGRSQNAPTNPRLRLAGASAFSSTEPPSATPSPFVTDGGNYILDCAFGPITDPAPLAAQIKAVIGVVDHGLFVGITERVYAAGPEGVRVYDRTR